MTDLPSLIAKLEAATGPSRELDCEIWTAANGRGQPMISVGPPTYTEVRLFCNPTPEIDWIGYDLYNTAPRYTASLDAALTLVPEEPLWLTIRIQHGGADDEGDPGCRGRGTFIDLGRDPYNVGSTHKNIAISICIAAMKARLA